MNSITMQPYPSYRQTGLSLVELMISLTIGLFLLLGITTLIVQQSSIRGEMEKSSRQIENGRYAMQVLRDDIQLAGYYGEYSPATGVATAIPANPCDTTMANLGWNSATPAVPVAIHGYAGGTADPTPTTCLPNYKPNTAILVVRRTETNITALVDIVGGANYLQVSLCQPPAPAPIPAPFVLATDAANFILTKRNCGTQLSDRSDLRKYVVRLYYISTCNFCGAGADTLPTLKMVENGAAVPTSLVEGIENMQFDYGVDTPNGDGSPDRYTPTPADADWANVMTVRVNLLARNNDPTTGYTDPKSYTVGSVSVGAGTASPFTDPASGGYKRHVYSSLVRVINPSGRRE